MAGIAQIDGAVFGEGLCRPPRPGGHDAIEHVDAAQHRADDVQRPSHPHQIARTILGKMGRGGVQHLEHHLLALAHRQTAHRIAVEADLGQRRHRLTTQIGVNTALDDAEQAVAVAGDESLFGPRRPTHGQIRRVLGLVRRRGERRAFVKGHGDVRIQRMLDLHGPFGGQMVLAAVQMGLEGDTAFIDGAQLGQTHHLKAAGIGQDRPRPVHEAMQPAQPFHPFRAGPQHQMIGVGQQNLRAGGRHRLGHHGLDRGGGAHRHEGRGVDLAMGGGHPAQTGGSIGFQQFKCGAHEAFSNRQASP